MSELKRKSMFNITAEFGGLMNEIEANEGEISEEMSASLDINESEMIKKAENYIEFIGDREAFIGRLDSEIERLTKMKKSNKNLIERLKDTLRFAAINFGEFSIFDGLKKIGLRRSESVEVLDESLIPTQFKNYVETVKIDKAAIKKAIKAGEEVPGAQVNERQNLAVK